jgi:hypothetical protein
MATAARINDGTALLDLHQAISSFRDEAHSVLLEASSVIHDTEAVLEERRQYWEAEVARREIEYHACLSYRDEDGYGRDCSCEAAALRQSEEELENVTRWITSVESTVEKYQTDAAHFNEFLGGDAIRATSFLGLKLRTVDEYSTASAGLAQAHAPSPADHGYAFEKAKQDMLRRALDDPSLGRAERGWLKQEINRLVQVQRAHAGGMSPPGGNKRNMRMPPGLDAGHRIPGINEPWNLRLEPAGINRARPAIAKRLGLDYLFR